MKDFNYTAAITWYDDLGGVIESIPIHSDDLMKDPPTELLLAFIMLGMADDVVEFDNEDGNVRFRGTYEDWETYSNEHDLPQARDQGAQVN